MRRWAPGSRRSTGGRRSGSGRPAVVPLGKRARLIVTVSTDQLEALERWAETQGHPDRSAAVRAWLDSLGETRTYVARLPWEDIGFSISPDGRISVEDDLVQPTGGTSCPWAATRLILMAQGGGYFAPDIFEPDPDIPGDDEIYLADIANELDRVISKTEILHKHMRP